MKDMKKSQASIFVIIATIIIIGGAFIFTYTSDSVNVFSKESSSYKVKQYVESCMSDLAEEGQRKLGRNGGWLYPPEMIFTDRSKPPRYNRQSQGLNFLGEYSDVKIPYWFYYDDSDETFKKKIPPYDSESKNSMKSQLKKYIDENLERKCIQNFQAFSDVYDVDYKPENINTSLEFEEDTINVGMNLPLKIRGVNTNSTEYVDDFSIEIENKLLIPYNLAKDIVRAEIGSSFIEHRIWDMLVPYMTIRNKDNLPPISEYTVQGDYDYEPWNLNEVEEHAKRIITSNIGRVQFYNTDAKIPEVEEGLENNSIAQGLRKIYVKDYLSNFSKTKEEKPNIFESYKNYKVRPTYQESFFPTYFDVGGPNAMGNMLLPTNEAGPLGGIISPFVFVEYNSNYKITAPIVFKISSSDFNDNFVFNLGVEANIRHNQPLAEKENVSTGTMPKDLKGNSLICDRRMFVSGPVKLNITDPINYGERRSDDDPKAGVSNAIVRFNCKGLSTCYVQSTEKNVDTFDGGTKTSLEMKLPVNCDPGVLTVEKYGHEKLTFTGLDPEKGKTINLGEKQMPSNREVSLDLSLTNPQNPNEIGSLIGEEEQGMVIFKNKNTDYVKVEEFDRSEQRSLNISLMPGEYGVEGFVIYNGSINIPEKEVCYSEGMVDQVTGDEECQQMPEINLDSWMRGKLKTDVSISTQELINAESIEVNMVDLGIPRSYDDLESLSERLDDGDEAGSVELNLLGEE